MNCRQARIDLALCVGEDLPDAARRESLRQHTAQCPGCRAHYKRLRSTLRVLESSDRDRTYDVGGSLWPQVSHRIRRMEEAPGPASRFNGWLPFVAVTAACAMLIVVMDVRNPVPSHAPSTKTVARDMIPGQSLLPDLPQLEERNSFLPVGADQRRSRGTDALEIDQYTTSKARLERNAQQPHAPQDE